MPAPWNSSSACLLARSDRIGGDRLNLLNRGHAIPLGVRSFLKQVSHTAPSTHNEGGAFLLFLHYEIKSIFHRGTHYFPGGILWAKAAREYEGGIWQ